MEDQENSKYRAPALERGLDILELLAKSSDPQSTRSICDALQLNRQQLYRMLQVLETRGFIEKLTSTDAYVITPKLMSLGMERAQYVDFLSFCKPILVELGEKTSQASHITEKL